MLAMNGMRQPHADACSAPRDDVHEPGRRRSENEPQGRACCGGAADEAAPPGRSLLRRVNHRASKLSAEREALHDAEYHQQDWRGDADLRVGRQQPDEQCRPAHERDRQRQQRAAPDAVPDSTEHEAADGPGAEAQREHRKGEQLLGHWA